MSTSPPQSPVQDIQINTPPPSPTALSLDFLHDTPHTRTTTVADITPSRRQKQLCIPPHNKQQHVASLESADKIFSSQVQPIEELFFIDALATPSAQDDTYEHHLELVLVDCIGFYQITNTIFVVQGWDVRRNAGTVSIHS